MTFARIILALLLAIMTTGGTLADDPVTATGLPAGLEELWEGGDRCGEPTAAQWALTLGMDYRLAGQVASQAKVIPYRFLLEDLVAEVWELAKSKGRGASSASRSARSARKTSIGGSPNIFGFTGHEMDPETGLVYMKGRYYDPEIGRFLSQDPFHGSVVEPPSLHPYNYAYANPTVYVDPDGRCVGGLQNTEFCQAIARAIEFQIAGDLVARAQQEIERREKVLEGRRAFREQMGREPLPDEVVWFEGSRALTAGFQEIDMSGRIEPDHAEWLLVGASVGTRMAVNSARAAGASTGQKIIAGATQLGDEFAGELVGVSPGDVAGVARMAQRGLAPRPPTFSAGPSGTLVESPYGPGVIVLPEGGSPVRPPSGHDSLPGLAKSPPSPSVPWRPSPSVPRRVEQPRDSLGRFLPKTNPGQRPPGEAAVDGFERQAREYGFEIVGREVAVNTPFGQRRYDVVLRDPDTGLTHGIEIKSSQIAFERFGPNERRQFAADRWLNRTGGAPAVGRFAGERIHSSTRVLWESE